MLLVHCFMAEIGKNSKSDHSAFCYFVLNVYVLFLEGLRAGTVEVTNGTGVSTSEFS